MKNIAMIKTNPTITVHTGRRDSVYTRHLRTLPISGNIRGIFRYTSRDDIDVASRRISTVNEQRCAKGWLCFNDEESFATSGQ